MTRRVHIRTDASLADTSRQLFEMLAIPSFEERDSVNYPGGSYFRGKLGDLQVRVWLTDPDDAVFSDCRCTIELEAGENGPYPPAEMFAAMVTRLLEAGCYVIREVASEPDAVDCVVYALGAEGELMAAAESRNRE